LSNDFEDLERLEPITDSSLGDAECGSSINPGIGLLNCSASKIGCTEWPGPRYDKGRGEGYERSYGRVWWLGKDRLVHRVVWEILHGAIPSGMMVCHKCDNPPCFRGDHLFLGTSTDNQRDSSGKGRTNNQWHWRVRQ